MIILQCIIHKSIKAMQKYHIFCFVINLCAMVLYIIINYCLVPTKINFHIVLLHSEILNGKIKKNNHAMNHSKLHHVIQNFLIKK